MWEPKSYEDRLLKRYLDTNSGSFCVEVPIGNDKEIWPKGSKIRRIDCIRIDNAVVENRFEEFNDDRFRELIKGNYIELIEAKRSLSRYGLGQVIVGLDMFKIQYGKDNNIKGILLCEEGDPALEVVCKNRGIEVVIIN